MQLEDNTFTTTLKAEYNTQYGYTEYYIDGKYTYKSTFENKGGFDVPFFNGNDDEIDETIWNVSYVQVPSSERAVLENQVKETINTIKKLNPKYNPTNAD
jgi:hypothetical protein